MKISVMKHRINVVFDDEVGRCVVSSPGSDVAAWYLQMDSYEQVAHDIGDCITTYLMGFGG